MDGFGLANLPFGIADGRVATRLGDGVAFVGDVVTDTAFEQSTLNAFLAEGPAAWAEVRQALQAHLGEPGRAGSLVPCSDVSLTLPVAVGDYVDFYSSLQHATNLGRIFRPEGEPLQPNWRHLPVGYHGRTGTIVVSGEPVRRPSGLVRTEGGVERRPTAALDLELEVGFVVGVGNEPGRPIAVDDADRHVFGVVLVNDWSARDIQAFEAQPLGPFLGKSFLTSISPWVVPLEALRPYFVDPPPQDPPPDPQLRAGRPWGIDLQLRVDLNGAEISRCSFADLYWTFAQQLAHLTSNGATTAPGDLFASGTVSGEGPESTGSLIERTWAGRRALRLADGSSRSYLVDGDTVALHGWAGDGDRRVRLGDVAGTVVG